jgi:biotin carboxyl carrier protein
MKPQDIEDLKQLIEFLKEHQVAEFEVDRGDLKVRLKFSQPESAGAGLGDLARLLASAPQGVAQASAAQTASADEAAFPRTPMRGCTWSSRRLSAPTLARLRRAPGRLSPLAITWTRAR